MKFVSGAELPEVLLPPVDAEKMKTMAALLADPNPIHWDLTVVRDLGMGDRPVNQGPNNMAYVVNAVAGWSGGPDRLRSLRVRFSGNVFAGDRLVVRGRVAEVREKEADVEVWLTRSEDEVVLSGTATVSVD